MHLWETIKNLFVKKKTSEIKGFNLNSLMIKCSEITPIYEDFSNKEVIEAFKNSSHRILPICRDSIDNITGALDIIGFIDKIDSHLEEIADLSEKKSVIYVPNSREVAYVMSLFAANEDLGLCVVVDEFGGTNGFITRESTFDGMIREMSLDYILKPEKDGSFIIDSKTHIGNVKNFLKIKELDNFQDHQFFATFLMTKFLPVHSLKEGVKINVENYEFIVHETDGKSIKSVIVRNINKMLPKNNF